MSKVLKVAAEVVGAVALIATGVGALGGGAIIGSLTFAAVGTIAGVAATVLSVAASATAKAPSTTISGNQDKFTANLDQGIPYAVGRTAVAGFIVHRQTFDWSGSKPSNAFQTFFAVWGGGGPYHAVEAFQVDGNAVTFSGDVGNDCAQGSYNDGHNTGWMWEHQQLGACPSPSALIATGYYPYPAGWSSTSKLSGYAAFSWTLKFDDSGKAYPGGVVPQPRGVLQGALVYDPRLDSTYPGGSGACRPLQEQTYVYSENPALHALTWALGRWQNGKRVLGIGMAAAAIVMPAYVEAANVSDANGWKVGGVVYSTDGKWDVLKKMLAACSGEPLQLGGTLSCVVDTPRVSLATITDDDIIGKCTIPGAPRIVDRINGVIPTYREETQDWQLVPAGKVSIADYVTADGKPRTKALTWELVQQVDQVGELATYAICNSREIDGIVLPLKLRWIGYKPGDAITVASSTVGLANQLVVLRKRSLDPASGAVTMTMRTETTGKHALALGQTTTAPPSPALQAVDRSELLQPGISASWSAIDGDGKPDDNATVGAPAGTSIGAGEVVVSNRWNDSGTWSDTGVWADTTIGSVSGMLAEDLVAAIADLDAQIASAGSDSTALLAQISTLASGLTAEVTRAQGEEGTLHTLVGSAQSTAVGAVSSVSTETTQRAAADGVITATLNTVSATASGAAAAVTSEAAARVSGDGALSARIDAVTASSGGTSSDVTNEAVARANADEALGGRIDTVTATVASNTAAITSEAGARADADTALSTRVDQVSAVASGASASVSSETTARTNADGALGIRIDTLTSSVGGVSATANAAYGAVTDGRFATSSYVNTVASTASSASASASAAQTAVTNIQTGLSQARLVLTADAGNGRAQIALHSDNYGGAGIDIVSDVTFRGQDGSGNKTIVGSTGVQVYDPSGNLIVRMGTW